jgi:hypothetical protein
LDSSITGKHGISIEQAKKLHRQIRGGFRPAATNQLRLGGVTTDDNDTIEVTRIRGVMRSAEERAVGDLVRALETHRDEVGDPQAMLAVEAIDDGAAAAMLDSSGAVSGYRKVSLEELFGKSEMEFEADLAAALTSYPLARMEYEAVWAMGQVIIFYVRGEEQNQPAD